MGSKALQGWRSGRPGSMQDGVPYRTQSPCFCGAQTRLFMRSLLPRQNTYTHTHPHATRSMFISQQWARHASSKTKASVPILSRCVCLKNLTLLPRSHLHPEVASAPHALNAKPSAQRHVWEKHIAITQNRQPRQAEEIEEQCAQWPCMACSAGHMAKWPPPAAEIRFACILLYNYGAHDWHGPLRPRLPSFHRGRWAQCWAYAAWRGPPVIDIGEWETAKLTQASTCSSRAVTRESLTTWLPRNPLRQHRPAKWQAPSTWEVRTSVLEAPVRKHRAPAPQERPGAGTRECTPEPSKNLNFEWHGPILNDFLAPLEHSKLEPLAVKRPASCPRTSGKLTCASRFHFLFSGTVDVFKATAQVSSFGFLAFENHSPSNQQPANPLTNGNSLLHHVIAEGVPLAAALRMPHCDRGAWPRPTSRTKPWAW